MHETLTEIDVYDIAITEVKILAIYMMIVKFILRLRLFIKVKRAIVVSNNLQSQLVKTVRIMV